MVVGPIMLLEALSSLLLLHWIPTPHSMIPFLTLFALLVLIWLSTFLLQMPQHFRLEKNKNHQAIHHLILGNWVRTLLWSLRSLALIHLTWLSLCQ
ncbi:MAG: hypothetical protein HC904_01130 [Blastochloris sp.]|nr:hypothetical protein [Blastochloris sp.]